MNLSLSVYYMMEPIIIISLCYATKTLNAEKDTCNISILGYRPNEQHAHSCIAILIICPTQKKTCLLPFSFSSSKK